MMYIGYFLICFLASVAGSICGIGGGVIIKPVLDASGMTDTVTISFLSGCTVLSMTTYTFLKEKFSGESVIQKEIAVPLALGSAMGGVFGKWIFNYLTVFFKNKSQIGAVQAVCLLIVTMGTMVYTIGKTKIRTYEIKRKIADCVIGFLLGILSSFLGIGGGPINLMVLSFFFSMDTKTAAEYSLYIILFSQITSLLQSYLSGNIPEFPKILLLLMVIGGIVGGVVGRCFNKRIVSRTVDKLFLILMLVIIIINIFNIYRFMN